LITKVHINGYKKFKNFSFTPNERINILVGANDSGKSTLLEAIRLCIEKKFGSAKVQDTPNPYWFNVEGVQEFFKALNSKGINDALQLLPSIYIEVHFDTPNGADHILSGMHNIEREESTGISLTIKFNKDYEQEIKEYFSKDKKDKEIPPVIPTEYYSMSWRGFSGHPVGGAKLQKILSIDSSSVHSSKGLDQYTRQVVDENLSFQDKNEISLEYRRLHYSLTSSALTEINERISTNLPLSSSKKGIVQLQIMESGASTWNSVIAPSIDNLPFSMAGQGSQVIAKVRLLLNNPPIKNEYIFIEEPENHLSHTHLREFLTIIEEMTSEQQVFITTHSPFVLNRLGLDKFILINGDNTQVFENLKKDTIQFFKKVSGFDTLRLILADKIIIVEGPSDEIIFNKMFTDMTGNSPESQGIDVMSIHGVSFARCFELAHIVNRQLFALRDNDDQDETHWKNKIKEYLEEGLRNMYIGNKEDGVTLEDQIYKVNRHILPAEYTPEDMKKSKTDTALKLSEMPNLMRPKYIENAINDLQKLP
jgi:hypothetical protein